MKLLKFILALAIISFVSCRDISDKINSDATDTELTDDDKKADLYAEDSQFIDDETESKTEGIVETDESTEKEVVAVDVNVEKGNEQLKPGKYYIIAGSFKDYTKAQELYKQLATKGYNDTQILDPVNQYSRVVIRSFNDETQARSELNRLRKQYNDNSIWLHIP